MSDEKIVLTLSQARALRSSLKKFPDLSRVVGEAVGLVGQLHARGRVKATSVTFWITKAADMDEVRA